nr:hypothetical protein [uncultured Selenomonas sp.]
MKPVKKTDLGLLLASAILRDAVQDAALVLPSITELQSLVAREVRPRILQYYLRSQREAIGRILALTLVKNISELEAEFVYGHYRHGRSIHYLSLHLPVQERQLYTLNEHILRRLSSLLFYRLTLADAYSPNIALNLLCVLDVRIGTFTLRADLSIAAGLLDALYEARRRCRALLSLQNRFLRDGEPEDEFSRVVKAKLENPFQKASELSEILFAGEKSELRLATMTDRINAHLRRYLAMAEEILEKNLCKSESVQFFNTAMPYD